MSPTLRLAWRYLSFHRVRTGLLVVCVGLVIVLPVTVNLLFDRFERALGARADATPLIVGAKGSRYDLVVSSLYFRGRMAEVLRNAELLRLRESGLGLPVPLYVRYTAQGFPVVGTTLDYFEARRLAVERGTLPLVLGDAVLGCEAAEALGAGPSGHVITDGETLYDLSASYPLRMRVTGVLARSGTPDDRAVFVDLKTAWVIEGIGHGHFDPGEEQRPGQVLKTEDGNVRLNDSVTKYMQITEENLGSFHFHEQPGRFPLTAILVWPEDRRSRASLFGRYRVSESAQLLVPREVVDELMGFLFRVKTFFDANAVVVGAATAMFLTLIVVLSLRLRRREMETLTKIGCSRFTVAKIQTVELAIVLLAGVTLAGALAGAAYAFLASSELLV